MDSAFGTEHGGRRRCGMLVVVVESGSESKRAKDCFTHSLSAVVALPTCMVRNVGHFWLGCLGFNINDFLLSCS